MVLPGTVSGVTIMESPILRTLAKWEPGTLTDWKTMQLDFSPNWISGSGSNNHPANGAADMAELRQPWYFPSKCRQSGRKYLLDNV